MTVVGGGRGVVREEWEEPLEEGLGMSYVAVVSCSWKISK